ncbi:MAG: 30S ribosomal protein S16 [Cytophagaceae bacterium]|nr:30S ribosomal protein S16 [Cytophagaceae bacterium]
MAVKIRLARRGRKKLAIFDVVVADARSPRDGRFIEKLGTYNPNTNPASIILNEDKALQWLMDGAQPSDTVRAMLSYKGVLLRRHLQIGVNKGAITQEIADGKFNDWKESKESKITGKVDTLASKQDADRKARLEAEAKKNAARAEALAKKNIVPEDVPAVAPVAEVAPEETPAEDVVVDAAPVAEAVVAETPAEVPVAEVAPEETPVEEVAVVETPVSEEVVAEAPAEVVAETPVVEAAPEEAPVEESAVVETPAAGDVVAEIPVAEAAPEETPVEETAVDVAPAPEAAATAAPAEEAPADEPTKKAK